MFTKLAVIAVACVLAASALNDPKPSLCWADALPPGSGLPQIVLGMDCVDKDLCVIAGGSNGAGFGVFAYDGKIAGQVYQMQMNNASLITMSIVARGTAANPIGVIGGVSTFFTPMPPFHYWDQAAKVWQPSAAPFEFVTVADSIGASKDGQTIVAPDGGQPSGFMVSSDHGKTFSFVNLTGYPSPGMPNCSMASNVAVTNANTWYVIIGQSPQTPSSSSSNSVGEQEASISARRGKTVASMTTGAKKKFSVEFNVGSTNVASGETCIGYAAQIIKTSDAGASWTSQLLMPNADFSFNDIDCYDATTCIAVGSGDYLSNVYMTTDGSTWKQVFSVTGNNGTGIPLFSLVRFVNRSTIWIAGSFEMPATQSQEGLFYFSKDGGKTFLGYPQLQPEIAAILALTFTSDGTGFAAGFTMQQSSTVIKYADQPYYGYFEQVSCLTNGCNFLCEAVLFPQGMCLQSSTGGIKAFCTPNDLEIKAYETTDCSGSFNTSSMPLNQCLNSTNGGPLPYFENVCNAQFREVQTMGRPSQRRVRLLD